MEMQELKDAATAPEAKTPDQTAADNQLGVVMAIERLFRAVNAGSYPLHVHDDVLAGMNFMAQFHKQLVSQLPPAVLEEVKRRNAPPAATEAPSEQPKA